MPRWHNGETCMARMPKPHGSTAGNPMKGFCKADGRVAVALRGRTFAFPPRRRQLAQTLRCRALAICDGECSRFVLATPERVAKQSRDRQRQGRERVRQDRMGPDGAGWGRMGAAMRIIGIDPGLRRLGWGVIDVAGGRLQHRANGTCLSGEGDLAGRLLALHRALTEIVAHHAPSHAAVEQTFVNRDPVGTLKLGQARAIAMLVPAQAGLPVGEYAPNAVKKAVVGVGHADKRQVAHMVALQFPGVAVDGPDAADALAVALCHAWHLQSAGRLQAAVARAMP